MGLCCLGLVLVVFVMSSTYEPVAYPLLNALWINQPAVGYHSRIIPVSLLISTVCYYGCEYLMARADLARRQASIQSKITPQSTATSAIISCCRRIFFSGMIRPAAGHLG